MLQLVQTLVDREYPAKTEQQQGNDEAPEVAQLAVAKWMLEVGWSLRLFKPKV